MTVQLTDDELDVIRGTLRGVSGVQRAVVFGSRAMQNAKNGSDVDLVLFGDIDRNDVARIHMHLEEETNLPYFFDVISYDDIQNDELKKHIDEFGVSVYERLHTEGSGGK